MNIIKLKTGASVLFYILLSIFTLITSAAHAANITVTASRNPVALDDSFHLVYEANSSVDEDPDFTPIYQYFDVLSSSQSTNMRSINGSWDLQKTWNLSLIAKEIGKVTVPAISFGKDISPAIQITVVSSSSANSISPDARGTIPAQIFLESSIDKKSGWVQSQFIYKIRLFRTVSIASASISDPKTSDPDAIIHSLGEDKYQTTRNGIRYEVFERSYAIFPQKSGPLKINPVTFEGRVNPTQARSIFDRFRMSGQLKRLRSKSVETNIKAAPDTINLQDWLPSSQLQLVEEWSDDINNIKAGDPITRTITIAAEGLTAVQLPDLSFNDIDNLKQYPDKAATEDRPTPSGITGLKQIKVALIPATAGNYLLPEIKLEWWNTLTNKKEVATLPAVTLTATGIVANNNYALPPAIKNEPPLNITAPTETITSPTTNSTESYWKWLSLFFALAWAITLVLFFKRSNNNKQPTKNKNDSNKISSKTAASLVKKHAKANNTSKTKSALITWAQAFYGNESIANLTLITELCSPQLAKSIKQLNHDLYSTDASTWHGNDLLIAFNKEQQFNNTRADTQTSPLKPLYNE
jgi:hypothetical protein